MKTISQIQQEIDDIFSKIKSYPIPRILKNSADPGCRFCGRIYNNMDQHIETEHPKEYAMKAFW